MSSRASTYSRQQKAGVTLSVARINKALRKGHQAKYVSSRAPLYVAGVMETMVDTVLKQAVENARAGPRNAKGELVVKRVDTADVIQAVRADPDLARLCSGFAFASNAAPIKPVMHILSGAQQEKRRLDKAMREAKKAGLD
jgi:histone H3/H4